MDAQGLPEGEITGVAPVLGGTQNVMVRFERGGRPYILRRPPLHARPKSNDVLRREARVLAALRDTPVAAPRLVAAQTEVQSELEPVFYLMEPVDGFNASMGLPEPHASDPAIRHRMALEAASALAVLGQVDPELLPGFGRPEGFLERQVPRWLRELDSYGGSTAIRGRTSPACGRRPRGSTPTGRRLHAGGHARRLSLREPAVRPRRARGWRPSWTGRCARSATRCSISAGCWPSCR